MRRRLSLLLALILLFIPVTAFAQNVGIEQDVPYYYLGEQVTGMTMAEQNADEPRPIASMSKLMTYLVIKDMVAEGAMGLEDKIVVTADAAALAVPGNSHFGLIAGESLSIDQLLMGLMVVSGNDAARQLAITAAGTEANFAQLMNAKAQELGLIDAAFYNASGLQEGANQNTMSAKGVFELARHIVTKYPEVLKYSEIRTINMPERGYSNISTMPLVGTMPGVDGLKTGYTSEAGNCLVSTYDVSAADPAKDFRVIGVVMGVKTKGIREPGMRTLLEYAAKNFDLETILSKDKVITTLPIAGAKELETEVYPAEDVRGIFAANSNLRTQIVLDDTVEAPLAAEAKVGSVEIYSGDRIIDSVDLVVRQPVEAAGIQTRISRLLEAIFNFIEDVFTA